MNQILISASVPASGWRLWQVAADLQNPQRFNSYVTEADVIDRRPDGEGIERVCRLHDGSRYLEQITDWREGVGFTAKIIQTPLPLDEGRYSLRIRPQGPKRCTVELELVYRLDAQRIGDRGAARRWKHQLSEGVTRILRGLSLLASTDLSLHPDGEPADPLPDRTRNRLTSTAPAPVRSPWPNHKS